LLCGEQFCSISANRRGVTRRFVQNCPLSGQGWERSSNPGARHQGCPFPTFTTWANGARFLYFAYGFVIANGWIVQNPSINGYSGGFGYNLAKRVTIVVEATKSETATTDASAFDILREVVKYVTPSSPINF
jgi:hypothetical protein